MTLREFLGNMDSKSVVAIGPADGNGYMYVGEAGNTDEIDLRYEEYLNMIIKRRDEVLTTGWKSYDLLDIYNKYMDEYVGPLEREVVEHYYKETDDGTAILIEGIEAGPVWTRDEYEKKYNVTYCGGYWTNAGMMSR